MKKYKKWTGSTQLEDRFRGLVLDSPNSFTKFDIGPMLDNYSETLHDVRALYENRIQYAFARGNGNETEAASSYTGSSILDQLRSILATRRKVDFDSAMATTPLGEDSTLATYFVHPENLVELQVLLMQHMNYFMSRSRSNSLAALQSSAPAADNVPAPADDKSDFFLLAADSPDRFAEEQSSLTVLERESRPGSTPQRAKICARWNTDDETEALIATRVGETSVHVTSLKRKYVNSFFDKSAPFPPRRGSDSLAKNVEELDAVRSPLTKDDKTQPLYSMSCDRSRFVGVRNTRENVLLATLDSAISIKPAGMYTANTEKTTFPYAVLLVRQEGMMHGKLVNILDRSHLVERVRGFSMEYHAIWHVCQPANASAPFWIPALSQDIRKLPPPALGHSDSNGTELSSGSASAPSGSVGTVSGPGMTDSSTAVGTTAGSSLMVSDLEQPPLRSFRKKRNRAQQEGPLAVEQRYWSEYDHPEEGVDDAYVIYIDPNEESSFDRLMASIGALFSRRKQPARDGESLLRSPQTPREDESSSDEDNAPSSGTRTHRGYGTVSCHEGSTRMKRQRGVRGPFLPPSTVICLAASAVILIIGYALAATGRHRLARAVYAGIIFAVASGLLFAIGGLVFLSRMRNVRRLAVAVAVGVVVVDAIAAGGLLAWMLG